MSTTNCSKARLVMKVISITVLITASVLLLYIAGCGGDSDESYNDTAAADESDSGTETCAWTNDGECDEPEGLDVCPEGTDVADCANTGSDDDDDDEGSSCGEPCPDGCCSLSGAICCQPPFCSGNCIGSPCC